MNKLKLCILASIFTCSVIWSSSFGYASSFSENSNLNDASLENYRVDVQLNTLDNTGYIEMVRDSDELLNFNAAHGAQLPDSVSNINSNEPLNLNETTISLQHTDPTGGLAEVGSNNGPALDGIPVAGDDYVPPPPETIPPAPVPPIAKENSNSFNGMG